MENLVTSARCPHCGKARFKGPLRHGLSPRVWEVVEEIYKGKRYKEVAYDLNLSIKTVGYYVQIIRKTWGVSNKVQIIRRAIELKKSEVTQEPL